MSSGEALWWLPTAALAVMLAFALAAVAAQPVRPARRWWMAGVLFGGALALAVSAWQQADSRAMLASETAQLHQLWSRLDELGRQLPAEPGAAPERTFDTVGAALASLHAKIKELEARIETLQEQSRRRSIDPETTAKLADFLRQSGGHRVVISCAPDDIEAYGYANQLATVLRAAGWEALGPEATTIFGEAPTMGLRLYVRNGTAPPEAATILVDAFSRFNIPFLSGITPNDAIPDTATTELFVSHKP